MHLMRTGLNSKLKFKRIQIYGWKEWWRQSIFKIWIQHSNRNIEKNSSWNEYRMKNIDNPKLNSAENLRGRVGSIDAWR